MALASSFVFKQYERRALFISIAIHAVLFLFFFFLGSLPSPSPISVRIVLEESAVPERLEIPLENEIEAVEKPTRQNKRRAQKKAHQNQSQSASKGSLKNPDTLSNPWSQYERQMHRRGAVDSPRRASSSSPQTAWGRESTGATTKQGADEAVSIPRGNTASTTRWKKGGARRLVSLPTIDYPASIRKRSGQGSVELLLVVGATGRVESVEVIKSSGYSKLDINAKNAYRNAVFSASPSGEKASGVVVVTFRMRDN